MPVITFLAANFVPKFIPEPLRKAAVWTTLIVAAIALLWAAKAMYDRSVVREHEQERAAESVEARDKASEERAADTIRDRTAENEREEAIRSAPNGNATLAPSTQALNCKRIEQAYTKEQLGKLVVYQEKCK